MSITKHYEIFWNGEGIVQSVQNLFNDQTGSFVKVFFWKWGGWKGCLKVWCDSFNPTNNTLCFHINSLPTGVMREEQNNKQATVAAA